MKIVINTCYGGFSLSKEALELFAELTNTTLGEWYPDYQYYEGLNEFEIPRDSLALVKVVEQLGSKANGRCADLRVVDIPDGVDWYIDEYDGQEEIHERHRIWNY